MFKQLAEAIRSLTAAINKMSQQTDIATKADLDKAEARIVKAIKAGGGIKDSDIKEATQDLGASTDALQNAVDKNK